MYQLSALSLYHYIILLRNYIIAQPALFRRPLLSRESS